MANDDSKIVQVTTERKGIGFRGPLRSSDMNDFQEAVVEDLQNLSSAVNTLNNKLTKALAVIHNENSHLRRQVDVLLQQRDYQEKVNAESGLISSRIIDFSDTTGISFPGGLNDTYSAMVSAEFGEATLPANGIESRFYTTSIRSGRIITAPDLRTDVTSVFDKGEGEGLVDYERGGLVAPGKPKWAFNGNNQQYWIRRVEFPLDSRTDQVECELTVDVPEGTSAEANLLELFTFPNGSVDVLSVSTASDLAGSFTTLDGFSAINNAVATRYHFPTIRVERIKVRLRQRNWVEENGKKVFYYGLQELGLKLVDYEKAYDPGASFGDNSTFVVKIDAPSGYAFDNLLRINPTPNFLLEDSGKRHVRVRITSDDTFSSWLWDSDSNLTPQDTNEGLLVNATSIYAAFELKYVNETGGSLSPYQVGTTPYVKGLGLSYTLLEV